MNLRLARCHVAFPWCLRPPHFSRSIQGIIDGPIPEPRPSIPSGPRAREAHYYVFRCMVCVCVCVSVNITVIRPNSTPSPGLRFRTAASHRGPGNQYAVQYEYPWFAGPGPGPGATLPVFREAIWMRPLSQKHRRDDVGGGLGSVSTPSLPKDKGAGIGCWSETGGSRLTSPPPHWPV